MSSSSSSSSRTKSKWSSFQPDDIMMFLPDLKTIKAKKKNEPRGSEQRHPFFRQHKLDVCQYTNEPERCIKDVGFIGQGTYSKVYTATNVCQAPPGIPAGVPFLVRRVIKQKRLYNVPPGFYLQTHLEHPHIVRTCVIYPDEIHKTVVVIQELVPGIELEELLKAQQEQRLKSSYDIAIIMYQMADALNYLHSNNLVHGDVKPSNMMYDPKHHYTTLIDMDSVQPDNSIIDFKGTVSFAAPEAMLSPPPFTPAIDMWSLGMVLYELIEGYDTSPINGDYVNLYNYIKKTDHPLNHLKIPISKSLGSLLVGLLQVDPTKRMTAKQVMEHPWVRSEINTHNISETHPYRTKKTLSKRTHSLSKKSGLKKRPRRTMKSI